MQMLHYFQKSVQEMWRTVPMYCLICLTLLLYAAIEVIYNTTVRDNAVPLWILAVILSWTALKSLAGQSLAAGVRARSIAWSLLLLIPVWLQCMKAGIWQLDMRVSLLLVTLAVLCYRYGIRAAFRALPIAGLTLVLIPVQEQFFLAVSYPFRLISTMLTVESLQLFGSSIQYHLTTIQLEGIQVAITDACSGISQLAVLFLLGYLIVQQKQYKHAFSALLHYSSLLPIIVIANSIRLVGTILLFHLIGEDAFSNRYHAALGFVFVIISVLMLYGIGMLFAEDELEETIDART